MKKLSLIAKGIKFDDFLNYPSNENWAVCSVFLKGIHVTEKIDKYINVHSYNRCCNLCNSCNLMKVIESERLAVRDSFKRIDDVEIIPEKSLIDTFGKVFHSSISWMLGYAIYLGYEEIYLHGVDLLQRREYLQQRDGTMFLLGYAKAKGIKIHIPAHSGLNVFLKDNLYGD